MASPRGKNVKAKGTHFWADEETHFMLYQLREVNISKYMDGRKTRNGKLFRKVAERLDKAGFKRTPEQIRVRWKHLKQAYYNAKKTNQVCGHSIASTPYSDVLEELLGHRPKPPAPGNGMDGGTGPRVSESLQDAEDLDDTIEIDDDEDSSASPERTCSSPQPSASPTFHVPEQRATYLCGRSRQGAEVEMFFQTMQQVQKRWLQQIQQSQDREERLVNSILESNAKMLSAMMEGIRNLRTLLPPAAPQQQQVNGQAGGECSATAEKTETQGEPEASVRQRIQDRVKDLKLLQEEVEAINRSADETVEHTEKSFSKLICLMEKRRSDVKQQVRSHQETEVRRLRELQEKLEQEITEMKRLSRTEGADHCLQNSPSPTDSSRVNPCPLRYFEDVTATISGVSDKLQDVLGENWTNISNTVIDVSLSEQEPKTRADFLQYAQNITLDPNTTHTLLSLSDDNRKATVMSDQQPHPSHPERFAGCYQVLSKESLTGRCYLEVECRGEGVYIAVAYKTISRAESSFQCAFGHNDKSWALYCFDKSYNCWHNNMHTPVSGPLSSRVGVYLDHSAGTLSFYSISKTMTLLHKVQTTFTQPLHAGLGFDWYPGDTVEFCNLE